MKNHKLWVSLTAIALSLTLTTSGWAKPDKDDWKDGKSSNHGKAVSRTARDKDGDDRNHGRKVSSVARSKSKRNKNSRYNRTRRYRTVRRYNRRTGRYENVRRWSYWDRQQRKWRRE